MLINSVRDNENNTWKRNEKNKKTKKKQENKPSRKDQGRTEAIAKVWEINNFVVHLS